MDSQPIQSETQIQQPKKNTLSKLLISLLVIIVIVVAGLGTYVWQHDKVNSLQKQLKSTSSVNTASKVPVSSSSTTTATSNNTTQYLDLYQYGIKFPLTKEIDDLYYSGYTQQAGNGVVGGDILDFSTESLSAAEPACSAYDTLPASSAGLEQGASPFGYILVTTTPVPASEVGSLDQDAGTLVAQANGHYLYYKHPQDTCVGADSQQDINPADQTLLQNQMNAFVAAIKNTQAIN